MACGYGTASQPTYQRPYVREVAPILGPLWIRKEGHRGLADLLHTHGCGGGSDGGNNRNDCCRRRAGCVGLAARQGACASHPHGGCGLALRVTPPTAWRVIGVPMAWRA